MVDVCVSDADLTVATTQDRQVLCTNRVAPGKKERVAAHSHVKGLGLNDAGEVKDSGVDGFVGQKTAREAAGIVVALISGKKMAGRAMLFGDALGWKKEDLRRIAKTTGGSVVHTMCDLNGDEVFDKAWLGDAEEVYEDAVEQEHLLDDCGHGRMYAAEAQTLVVQAAEDKEVSACEVLYHAHVFGATRTPEPTDLGRRVDDVRKRRLQALNGSDNNARAARDVSL